MPSERRRSLLDKPSVDLILGFALNRDHNKRFNNCSVAHSNQNKKIHLLNRATLNRCDVDPQRP